MKIRHHPRDQPCRILLGTRGACGIGDRRGVRISGVVEISVGAAYIREGEGSKFSELLLQLDVPLVGVGRLEVRIIIVPGDRPGAGGCDGVSEVTINRTEWYNRSAGSVCIARKPRRPGPVGRF